MFVRNGTSLNIIFRKYKTVAYESMFVLFQSNYYQTAYWHPISFPYYESIGVNSLTATPNNCKDFAIRLPTLIAFHTSSNLRQISVSIFVSGTNSLRRHNRIPGRQYMQIEQQIPFMSLRDGVRCKAIEGGSLSELRPSFRCLWH